MCITPQAEKCGIACVVPPPSFMPPFALDKGTNGVSADSFRFAIRKQLTSHLCMRLANAPKVCVLSSPPPSCLSTHISMCGKRYLSLSKELCSGNGELHHFSSHDKVRIGHEQNSQYY